MSCCRRKGAKVMIKKRMIMIVIMPRKTALTIVSFQEGPPCMNTVAFSLKNP